LLPGSAKHCVPPRLRHGNWGWRKYQHHGRWQRLPPTVPMARIWVVATAAAAWARAGKRAVTSAWRSRSASVTAAPMRRPPSAVPAMPCSSGMRLTLTSTSGTGMPGPPMRSFMRPSRSVPPASTWARGPCAASAAIASASEAAST